MKRALAWVASLSLIVGSTIGAGGPSAHAAPPTADWRATAGGDVASVSLTAVGIDLAGARLATTLSDSGSQLTPRSSSTSSNLGAAIAGIDLDVASNSVTAPPGGTETGTLVGVNVLGAVELGALETSNEARWSGDTECVAGDLLADSQVQTAGVEVGVPVVLPEILGTGVASTTGRTELVAGDSAFNRSVRATATGSIAALTVLGEITVNVAGTPTLIATSDGSAGGSGATYDSGLITVTDGDGDSTTLAAGAEITLGVGLATATIRAGEATTTVSATGAVTSSATVLSIEVNGAGVAATVDLLPLRASASAPTGGIDCPVPAPVITTPEDGSVISDTTPDIAGTGEPGATIALTIDGTEVADAATVGEDGTWSYPTTTPLSPGDHVVTATQTLDGTTSDPSEEVEFTVDATAPDAPVVLTPADGSVTDDTTPTVTGTAEPGAEVEVFIDGESIGTVTAVRIVYACWVDPSFSRDNWRADPAKAGGGALMDLAPHGLDLVDHLLGEPVMEVAALTQNRVQDYAVDDGAALIGRTASGVLVQLHVAYNCPEALPRRRLEVLGTRGQITAERTMGQVPGGKLWLTDGRLGLRRQVEVPHAGISPFTRQMEAFARWLTTGEGRDFDLARDLHTMRLLDRAYRSAACP